MPTFPNHETFFLFFQAKASFGKCPFLLPLLWQLNSLVNINPIIAYISNLFQKFVKRIYNRPQHLEIISTKKLSTKTQGDRKTISYSISANEHNPWWIPGFLRSPSPYHKEKRHVTSNLWECFEMYVTKHRNPNVFEQKFIYKFMLAPYTYSRWCFKASITSLKVDTFMSATFLRIRTR